MNSYPELDAVFREVRAFFDAQTGEPRSWAPAPGLADRLEGLAAKIRAFEMRRDLERHAHDVAPGQESMAPMLGGDFHSH